MELPSPQVAAFVQRQRLAHLATANREGRPHVVPVCFVFIDGLFYTPVDEKPKRTDRLRRLRNIEENPSVALVFDHYEEDWQRLGYVLVRGRATVLHGSDRPEVLAALRQKYAQYTSMALEKRPLIAITPERLASWGKLEG